MATNRRTHREPVPGVDAEQLRELLAPLLSEVASQTVTEAEEPESEEPPTIEPPGPRQTTGYVHISVRLIAELSKDYGPGVARDDGQPIGDIPEVADWISRLKPGKVMIGNADG